MTRIDGRILRTTCDDDFFLFHESGNRKPVYVNSSIRSILTVSEILPAIYARTNCVSK